MIPLPVKKLRPSIHWPYSELSSTSMANNFKTKFFWFLFESRFKFQFRFFYDLSSSEKIENRFVSDLGRLSRTDRKSTEKVSNLARIISLALLVPEMRPWHQSSTAQYFWKSVVKGVKGEKVVTTTSSNWTPPSLSIYTEGRSGDGGYVCNR